MFEEMFQYLENYMLEHGGNVCQNKNQSFRLRTEHTRRVFAWLQRPIKENPPQKLRKEELLIACIFHDIGYAKGGENHAFYSCEIFREYANKNGINEEKTEYICKLIGNHSAKEKLRDGGIEYELILLMEADLLDEEGALSILLDALAEGKEDAVSYRKVYDRLLKYPMKILDYNPMVTLAGQRFWREKQQLVQRFMKHMARDLGIEDGC